MYVREWIVLTGSTHKLDPGVHVASTADLHASPLIRHLVVYSSMV